MTSKGTNERKPPIPKFVASVPPSGPTGAPRPQVSSDKQPIVQN